MAFRAAISVFLISILSSCHSSPFSFDDGQTRWTYSPEQRTAIDMANPRGINIDRIGDYIGDLEQQALDLETKITALLVELRALRNQMAPKPNDEVVELRPLLPTATPKKLKVNLPVPERPAVNIDEANRSILKDDKAEKTITKPDNKIIKSKSGVVKVRYGLHDHKTRLVFDINGATGHELDYDQEAGLLTITLPKTGWSTERRKNYNLNQLLGYDVNTSENSSIIAIAVKNTRKVTVEKLGKTASKPNRLVVDLIKG